MFDQSFVQGTARTRRPIAVAASFTGQLLIVGLTILFPMLRTEMIMTSRMMGLIRAPQPIGDNRPVVEKAPPRSGPHKGSAIRVFSPAIFRAPARVPDKILPDDGAAPELFTGDVGPSIAGALPGVPGGTGMDLTVVPAIALPKTPESAPPQAPPIRVRVGGIVQAGRIMRQPMPVYPPLAKQARVSGIVRLEAVIARDGTVMSLRVKSGHPLLTQAALDAVRQWLYQPTTLNGDAVEVLTEIEVHFKLAE